MNYKGLDDMKLVLNTSYGCPALTKDALEYLGIEKLSQLSRKDEKLIDLIKNCKSYNFKVQPDYSSLEVVDVEDCATFEIINYDGIESIVPIVRK